MNLDQYLTIEAQRAVNDKEREDRETIERLEAIFKYVLEHHSINFPGVTIQGSIHQADDFEQHAVMTVGKYGTLDITIRREGGGWKIAMASGYTHKDGITCFRAHKNIHEAMGCLKLAWDRRAKFSEAAKRHLENIAE